MKHFRETFLSDSLRYQYNLPPTFLFPSSRSQSKQLSVHSTVEIFRKFRNLRNIHTLFFFSTHTAWAVSEKIHFIKSKTAHRLRLPSFLYMYFFLSFLLLLFFSFFLRASPYDTIISQIPSEISSLFVGFFIRISTFPGTFSGSLAFTFPTL